jgi:hypothetical protein
MTEKDLDDLVNLLMSRSENAHTKKLNDLLDGIILRHPNFGDDFEKLKAKVNQENIYFIRDGWAEVHDLFRKDHEDYVVSLSLSCQEGRFSLDNLQKNLTIVSRESFYGKKEKDRLLELVSKIKDTAELRIRYQEFREEIAAKFLSKKGIKWEE